jgi:hypothetical protein
MATLRAFQTEMDQIHAREANKQRSELAAAAKAREAATKNKAKIDPFAVSDKAHKADNAPRSSEESTKPTATVPTLKTEGAEGDEQRIRDEEEATIIVCLILLDY